MRKHTNEYEHFPARISIFTDVCKNEIQGGANVMEIWLAVLLIVLAGVICGIVSFLAGVAHRKKIAEAEIGSAEQEAKRIVSDAIKTAEAKKKEAI